MKTYIHYLLFVVALCLSSICDAAAQTRPAKFEFTIENIMRGPELYGREPTNVRWTSDSKWIYFSWLEPGADWRATARNFRVRAEAGAKPERVSAAVLAAAAPEFLSWTASPDKRTGMLAIGGDIQLKDLATGTTHFLTQTSEAESDPVFGADGSEIFFTRGGNIFSIKLTGGLIRQLTDIRTVDAVANVAATTLGRGGAGTGRGGAAAQGDGGRGGNAQGAAGQRSALRDQQRALIDALNDRIWRDSANAADAAATRAGGAGRSGGGGTAAVTLRPLSLLANERVSSLSVSPNGRAVIITTSTPAVGTLSTVVPNYVTESGYTEDIPGRTKVGDAQGGGRILYMSISSGVVKVLQIAAEDTAAGARGSSTTLAGWNETGTHALLLTFTRDFKKRYISTITADSGIVRSVEVLRDSAWVGGPCSRCAGWYDNGRRLYYVSEADGYAQLYSANADGSGRTQMTKGNFEVMRVDLSNDRSNFFITSSEGSPFEQHFFKMSVAGGARTKITAKAGGHNVTLSPDEKIIADVFSELNRPPELFVQAASSDASTTQVTLSPTAEWLSFNWMKPPIVSIPASDGVAVPAHLYEPKAMGARPNGAAVIFVHGAGYLHEVHNYWKSSYPREYMFNQFLASKGFVVLDIDYRGSAGYGRDWRTAIYRWMGGRDLQDQVDGVKYLKSKYRIDPERVGLYGGSYGGFITLMALFTEPKYFGAGAALRSVTNWANYNHGYTAPILNFPDSDTLAYRRSSPIFFAEGLEDPLLMAHGMVDVNVNFQDIVELTERLIELGKKNWTLAPYPVEDHGFVRPASWIDEYSRVYDLFDRVLAKGKKQ